MKAVIFSALLALAATGAWAEGQAHKVAVHVNQNDPQVMNMALNNVANLTAYYEEQGDTVTVEVVTYGPGLTMLIDGESPVADRVAAMSLEMDNLQFSACENTLTAMQKNAGHDIPLMSEAVMVPSGVVRLIELQEDGYAYVRP